MISRLELGSTGLADHLALFPELQERLGDILQGALAKVASPGFQHSKEQVIIAEAFFNKKPDLLEDDRRAVVALIKGAGGLKELKTHLKDWETSMRGPSSSLPIPKPLFVLMGQTSKIVDGAAYQSRKISDQEFFVALPDKVLKEPLLHELVQGAVKEAHAYFQDVIKQCLQELYSTAQIIKWEKLYHQVEVEANDQDLKRRTSSRSDWFDEIKLAQPQVNLGYVVRLSV